MSFTQDKIIAIRQNRLDSSNKMYIYKNEEPENITKVNIKDGGQLNEIYSALLLKENTKFMLLDGNDLKKTYMLDLEYNSIITKWEHDRSVSYTVLFNKFSFNCTII